MESENGNRTMGRIRTMIRPSPAPVLHPLPFYLETTRGRIAPVLHPMHPFFAPAGAIVHCIKKVVQSQRTCKSQVLFFGFWAKNAGFLPFRFKLTTSSFNTRPKINPKINFLAFRGAENRWGSGILGVLRRSIKRSIQAVNAGDWQRRARDDGLFHIRSVSPPE